MESKNYINKLDKNFVVCPLCQGTGLQEHKDALPLSSCNSLPLLNNEYGKKLEIKAKNNLENYNSNDVQFSDFSESSQEVNREDLISIIDHFLEDSKKVNKSTDTLKQALQKLKHNIPDENIHGLKSLLSMSRSHSALIESNMPIIYRKLSSLLQSLKLQYIISAAHLAAKFFETMRYEKRPEFDELASILLLKVAHTNKNVREAANNALNTMILTISPRQCVEVLTSVKGAGNKRPEVRIAVSVLLEAIINSIEAENLLHSPSLKNMRKKILETIALFMIDGNYDTRMKARKIIKFFMNSGGFENCFYQDVDPELIRKIEKEFTSVKFECV